METVSPRPLHQISRKLKSHNQAQISPPHRGSFGRPITMPPCPTFQYRSPFTTNSGLSFHHPCSTHVLKSLEIFVMAQTCHGTKRIKIARRPHTYGNTKHRYSTPIGQFVTKTWLMLLQKHAFQNVPQKLFPSTSRWCVRSRPPLHTNYITPSHKCGHWVCARLSNLHSFWIWIQLHKTEVITLHNE